MAFRRCLLAMLACLSLTGAAGFFACKKKKDNPPATASGTDTTAPTVSNTSASCNQTVSGTVALSATASDDVGVAKVEFIVGATLLATDTSSPYEASWVTTGNSNVSHTVTAKAYDSAGNTATSACSVTLNNTSSTDTTAPSVSPLGDTTSECTTTITKAITLKAKATDNAGISKVEFFIDGTLLGQGTATGQANEYGLAFSGAGIASGSSHVIRAKATDTSGNTSENNCNMGIKKRVFVTNAHTTSGSFGGQSGANTFCKNAADAAGHTGMAWTAWISDDFAHARDLVALDVGPWYRMDQVTPVFNNRAALSSNPQAAISVNESGTNIGSHPVWTGTDSGGSKTAGFTCSGWSATSGTGVVGDSALATSEWTQAGGTNQTSPQTCAGTAHLYCFEQ